MARSFFRDIEAEAYAAMLIAVVTPEDWVLPPF